MLRNIDFIIVFIIIISASLTGIIYNVFSSANIPLIRTRIELENTDDSLFQKLNKIDEKTHSYIDSINIVSESKTSFENNKTTDKNIVAKSEELIVSPKIISLKQAIILFSKSNVQFIDARDKWDFSEGHISGALNIPEYSFDKNGIEILNLDKKNIFIVYCGADDCDLSTRLAGKLFEIGFKNMFVLKAGFEAWAENNHPVERVNDKNN